MKIIRYEDIPGNVHYGCVKADGRAERLIGTPFTQLTSTNEPATIKKLLTPIVPTSILCIGLNYRKHAEETHAKIPEFPVLFAKGINAALNPGDSIQIPTHLPSNEVDYECELAVIISKPCKNVSKQTAFNYILGYTCANDVSARDWQITRGGSQWCRGKSFDTFAPFGPHIVTPDEIPFPNTLGIRTIVNGTIVQDANTSDMIFDIPTLIEFLSSSTTLLPGTVIFTGTPSGVGMAQTPPRWLKPGDIVTVEIDHIGQLTSPVELEKTL